MTSRIRPLLTLSNKDLWSFVVVSKQCASRAGNIFLVHISNIPSPVLPTSIISSKTRKEVPLTSGYFSLPEETIVELLPKLAEGSKFLAVCNRSPRATVLFNEEQPPKNSLKVSQRRHIAISKAATFLAAV